MAAALARIGRQLTITHFFCTRCGDAFKHSSSVTGLQQRKPLTILSQPAQFFSTKTQESPKAYDQSTEEDELFRQVTVEVKSHDKSVLKSYSQFVSMAASELGVNIARVFEPPKVITRYSLLKSVHIYKKHFVQYEIRTHFAVFELKYLTGSTADTFLEYIQRNLPEGMAMKVSKYRLERLPAHLSSPPKPQPEL
ncbi:hypothetical protein C0Q70_13868 [Pomacea canaliculata]|uniref:Small ribosomal subunit protein uS10m n=1 Tax=Pomacea canaliculata TaxID=400727 RepID=A0A2T7NYF6_POMCA|nr:28S ribosomal protein S10, mitochondrial-like [Pomacea canaliculata]PVD26199.1 hypothetical protein C0Q70_13868 [Pomacea canaliculata]